MNDSDSDREPEPILEEVNIYPLISAAKPVISPTHSLEKEVPFKAVPMPQDFISKFKKGLFRRQGTIDDYPFACNFECGNLESVVQSNGNTFLLKLRNDTNSRHQSSWFYFKVRGIRSAKFCVRGLPKRNLLYESGMKLCIREGEKWQRGGTYISYEAEDNGEYTLKFQMSFAHTQQPTEIATCFPYSYSDVQALLKKLCKRHPKLVKRQTIGRSVLGNDVECLVFAAGPQKPVVIVSARVHPSETVSSFIAQGLLEWLVSSEEARQLTDAFEVRVIPMINPDGVTRGNHRFSFAGTDLNRKWKNPGHRLHPQIYHLRNYIQELDPRRIRMIVDLHGHSRKKGVFFYGCEEEKSPESKVRQFPYLMSKLSSYYDYNKSCFRVQESKEGTARIFLWKLLKMPCVYTLECSLCGSEQSKKNFEIVDLMKIGADLGRGFYIFFSDMIKQSTETVATLKKHIQEEFKKDANILLTEEGSEGSESQPSQGQIEQEKVIEAIEEMKHQKQSTKIFEATNSSRQPNFHVTDEKGLTELKSYRKKVTTSHHYQSDRRKKALSLVSKIDASQTFSSFQPDKFMVDRHAQYINRKRTETDRKVKYLDEILLESEPLFDIPYTMTTENCSTKLQTAEERAQKGQKLEQSKADTVGADGFKTGFYGAQYVRVKKYAEKILKDRQRKQPETPISNIHQPPHSIFERPSRHGLKPTPTDLKLEIIPLRMKKKDDDLPEISKRMKSYSRRSTTISK